MKTTTCCRLCLLLAAVAAAGLLTGCGSAGPSIGGSGVGADGTPWPQRPARATGAASAADAPRALVTLVLRGTAAKDDALAVNVAAVKLKYEKDRWLGVAAGDSLQKLAKFPVRIDDKGAVVLLWRDTIARRAYTDIQVSFTKVKTTLERGKQSVPLTIDTVTLPLGTWTPQADAPNTLLISLDGAKVKATAASARLGAEAFAVKTALPTGSIAGTLTPPTPAAKVEALWDGTQVSFGRATPQPDGAFTLPNLPPGKYRLQVSADGYQLAQPLEKPVAVEDKAVTLETLQLVKTEPKPAP